MEYGPVTPGLKPPFPVLINTNLIKIMWSPIGS